MITADANWAASIRDLFGAKGESWFLAEIPGDPWSKMRPRHTKTGQTYQDPADRQAEADMGWKLIAAAAGRPRPFFAGNVMLACRFYRASAHTIDADNMLKHICDAGQKILWHDDAQATFTLADIQLDAARPRTIIMAAPHASTMLRGDNRAQRPPRRRPVVNPRFRS